MCRPTIVDATVFAYVTIIRRCPLANARLKTIVEGFPALVAHARHIENRHFPEFVDAKESRDGDGAGGSTADIAAARRQRHKNYVSAGVAAAAVAAYLFAFGGRGVLRTIF